MSDNYMYILGGEALNGPEFPAPKTVTVLSPVLVHASRMEIKNYSKIFKRYDANRDQYLDVEDIALMLQRLGIETSRDQLSIIIKEVDEDKDNRLCLNEFLSIFKKGAAGELKNSVLLQLYKHLHMKDKELVIANKQIP